MPLMDTNSSNNVAISKPYDRFKILWLLLKSQLTILDALSLGFEGDYLEIMDFTVNDF